LDFSGAEEEGEAGRAIESLNSHQGEEGMVSLSPPLAEWLKEFNSRMAHWRENGGVVTVETARKGISMTAKFMHPTLVEVPFVTDILCSKSECGSEPVPVRIYHPAPEQPLPVLVYFHGGGHVVGTLDDRSEERRVGKECRRLCRSRWSPYH
jgi:acetyl esterase/lipase